MTLYTHTIYNTCIQVIEYVQEIKHGKTNTFLLQNNNMNGSIK